MARIRNLRKTRLLIVDDSAKLREGLISLCELQSELEVVGTARDGVEALEAIRSLKPDVVSLDIRMPRMSGIEVLRVIRRERLTCTPIVLCGMADEFFRRKCVALGARYVFDKGTELEEFLEVLGRSHQTKRRRPATPKPTHVSAKVRRGNSGASRMRKGGK